MAHEKVIKTSAHENVPFIEEKKPRPCYHDKVRQMIFLVGAEADNFKAWKGLTPVQIFQRRMKTFSSGWTNKDMLD